VDIELDERWCIGGKPHGGYLLRELVRPLLTPAHPHPLAVSAHFLRSPDPGPAQVETEVLREGRRVSSYRSRLLQGATTVEALVTTGSLDPVAEPFWTRTEMPVLPPPQDCLRATPDSTPGLRVGHLEFVDIRWADMPASSPETSQACFTTWLRMDGSEAGVLDLMVLCDALPPMTIDMGLPGWAPTVELTVLVRGVPAPGWLVGEQRSVLLQDGWMDETMTLWDSRGRVVCQARQLASYRVTIARPEVSR